MYVSLMLIRFLTASRTPLPIALALSEMFQQQDGSLVGSMSPTFSFSPTSDFPDDSPHDSVNCGPDRRRVHIEDHIAGFHRIPMDFTSRTLPACGARSTLSQLNPAFTAGTPV